MWLAPFVTTSFKTLEGEGEEMLPVMVEGAQLLCFSHFLSMLSPSTDRGHGTVNCGQGGDRWSSWPKSLKRLKSLPLPVWTSQLIFQWAAQVSTELYMVQREMTQSDQIPPSYLYHSKSCAPFACLMVEEHHRWKKIVSGYGGVLILWRLLGQGYLSFENRWYRPKGWWLGAKILGEIIWMKRYWTRSVVLNAFWEIWANSQELCFRHLCGNLKEQYLHGDHTWSLWCCPGDLLGWVMPRVPSGIQWVNTGVISVKHLKNVFIRSVPC